MVRDGDLDDLEAAHADQRGEETVHALVQGEALEALAFIDFEAAGGILDVILREPVADAVGDFGLEAAGDFIFVLPVLAPAVDHVGVGSEHFHEAEDFGGIILHVGIDSAPDFAPGVAKTGIHGGGLAGVFFEMNDAEPGVFGGELEEFGAGAVGGAVVHDDGFVAEATRLEDFADALDERFDIAFFVEGGGDNGEVGLGVGLQG